MAASSKGLVVVTPQSFRDYLKGEGFQSALRESISKHVEPDRLVRVAVSALSKETKLQECSMLSLANAVADAARIGLEPGISVLGHAYIVPYFNPKAGMLEAQLQISYKGKAELFRRSGFGSRLEARTVRERDEFDIQQGTDPRIHHRFDIREDRGPIVGYYAVAFYRKGKGDPQFDTMTPKEVEHVRRTFSKAPDSPAWKNHHEAMAWAKVCHRLEKALPMAAEQQEAHDLDEESRDIVQGKVVASEDRTVTERSTERHERPVTLNGQVPVSTSDPARPYYEDDPPAQQEPRGEAQPVEPAEGAPESAGLAGKAGDGQNGGKRSRTLAKAQDRAPGVSSQREQQASAGEQGTLAAGEPAPKGEPPPAAPIHEDPGPCEKTTGCLRPNGHRDFCSGKRAGA